MICDLYHINVALLDASCDEMLIDNDTHAMGVSGHVKDAEDVSKNLRNTLKRGSKRSKGINSIYLPRRAQGDPDDPAGETDTSGASNRDEDSICVPKKLINASELGRKRLEQREEDSSPQGARNELGSEVATPSDTHKRQERSKNVRNGRIDRTNAPDRNRAPRGHRGE